MSLSVTVDALASEPRTESGPLPLVARLGEALEARAVPYCQWKGHSKRTRWETGLGDIDLLVERTAMPAFAAVLNELRFKLALPSVPDPSGAQHYFGLDERSGRLIHVHAYARLVLGVPWRTRYRLPIESAVLRSATWRHVFRSPAPEFELLLFVLRMTLRHAPRDLVRRTAPGWLHAARSDLDRVEEECPREALTEALARHLPQVEQALFDACRHALTPRSDPWHRVALRGLLQHHLRPFAERPTATAVLHAAVHRATGAAPGLRLAGGGCVVALVGGDGAGKSTCARALTAWLAAGLAATRFHLGLPPRSLATLAVGAALRIARRLAVPQVVDHLDLLRSLCTARDRYRTSRRALRWAARGGVALCERYPIAENWVHAGPSEVQDRFSNVQSTLAARLRRWEHRQYERIPRPDAVFVLRLDPEEAVRRKSTEPADYVRARARMIWDADWSRGGTRVVDVTRPLADVMATLKAELWRVL